jgi:hypothetical protein
MRSPALLARELGWKGFVVFQLLMGGTVLASLIHVPFALHLGWKVANTSPDDSLVLLGLETVALLSGYVYSGVLGLC